MDDLSPEITKKYEVLEKMGEGGMGAVYKVRHRRVGAFQVIKLIRASLQAREDLRERFRREAMTAMQLRHPNIVEVTDYDVTEDGTAYIVMEFIQGVNLREILARARGPLDYRFVVNIAQQALAALGYMHRKKNVHRDISPDNFVLTRDDDGNPHVKLIDLGITKSAEQQTLTKAQGFLGKASYAPPEQFRGEADTRSDLYAFGVMLYELLTDSKPIVGSNELAIMASHLADRPRPFSASDPAGRVPDKLRAIVMKALEKDPAARWQTAQEFAADLKTCEAPLLEKTIEVTIPILLADAPASGEEEQEDWDEAKAVDSIVVWERYLERNPHSPRAGRARVFLEALETREEQDWQRAANADTIEGWREFIGNHGDSSRVSKARRRLEKLELLLEEERAWTEAAAADSVASWRRFLTEHATSARADKARGRVAQAKEREYLSREQERERSARAIALRIDTEESLLAFLESFPSSPAAADVRQRIATLEAARIETAAWEAALEENTVAAWKSFIARHPTSRKSETRKNLRAAEEEARRQVEVDAWTAATTDDTREAYNTFLRNHPSATTAPEAKRRLEAIEAEKRERDAWAAATTADAVEAFIRTYPESPHVAEAPLRLEAIAAEHFPWTVARMKEDPAAFLRDHPKSGYAPEARQRLDELKAGEQRERSLEAAKQAWTKASSRGAIEQFLRDYPDSPWTEEAKRRLAPFAAEDELQREKRSASEEQGYAEEAEAWRIADESGSYGALWAFTRRFPHSAHAAEARRRLSVMDSAEQQQRTRRADESAWEGARTSKAYDRFARIYPHSPHAAEARRLAAELEAEAETRRKQWREQQAWKAAKKAGTPEEFRRFLHEHPESAFVDSARRALEEFQSWEPCVREEVAAWDETTKAGTDRAFRAFLRRYPFSVHAPDAQVRLHVIEEEDRAWLRATAVGTTAAIEEFASRHPHSHVAGVQQRRKTLQLREDQEAQRKAAEARRLDAVAQRAVNAEALRLETAKYERTAIDWLWETLTTGKRIGCFSGGLIAVGALLVFLGWSVVIAKGPQGWPEMVFGAVVLAAASYRLLRWPAMACVLVVLVVMAVIAYGQRFQPSPRSQVTATVGPSTATNSTAPAGAAADP